MQERRLLQDRAGDGAGGNSSPPDDGTLEFSPPEYLIAGRCAVDATQAKGFDCTRCTEVGPGTPVGCRLVRGLKGPH